MSFWDSLHAFDRFQQRHRPLSFVMAVVKKFTDDQAGQLAALISYYAFVSLFPLLLVFVTVVGFVLQGDPAEQQRILNGALGEIPLIRSQLELHPLKGSGAGLAIGIVGALLAGMGLTNACQTAFNRIWHVPFKDRPNFLLVRARGLVMLAVLGTLTVVSTVAAGLVGAVDLGELGVVADIALGFCINLAVFWVAFKYLTAAELSWRDLLPGAVTAAVFWQLLQHVGRLYFENALKRTGPLYGVFALVLGLLAWLFLGAQLTIFAAEVNVVRGRRLWPRSLFGDPLVEADRRALSESAETEERVPEENVDVDFDGPPVSSA
ncbi:MAG TPA: YihY/virulence factor BrkB family protein [Solirubrobacteraceae bacterium]|jgi:YihY family inner membrane protein|nr:YihY/virulence factor BrkB family protein [Solirubrobacteraceae bacterium]